MDNTKYEGRVKFYDKHKGWGFITFNENEDVFFHYTEVERFIGKKKDLLPDTKVVFNIETKRGKLVAVNLTELGAFKYV